MNLLFGGFALGREKLELVQQAGGRACSATLDRSALGFSLPAACAPVAWQLGVLVSHAWFLAPTALQRRGEYVDMQYLTETRTTLVYNMPLAEVGAGRHAGTAGAGAAPSRPRAGAGRVGGRDAERWMQDAERSRHAWCLAAT